MKLTIFTPTYNRANTIVRTYQSLLKQTNKDFEWLIVDDGSTDGTENVVRPWINVAIFPIRYIQQNNEGKYRAYNNGLRNARGRLFFCVDSDDWLPDNSVELILKFENALFADSILAGIVSLKNYPNKKIIGEPFSEEITRSSLYNLEANGQGGERSLVFKTEIARQYLFPEETHEKFITESVVYDRYEGKYEFLVSNNIFTTCEYQQEGLSSNPRKLMLRNPAGYKLYFAQRIDLMQSLEQRIICILKYHAFRCMLASNVYAYTGKHKLLTSLLSPLGCILKKYYMYSI